jgi:nucleolar protein 6
MGNTSKSNDASRAERKAKKRKLEDAVPDLPGDVDIPTLEETGDKTQSNDEGVKTKKRKGNSTVEDGSVSVGKDRGQHKATKIKRTSADGSKRNEQTLGRDVALIDESLQGQPATLEYSNEDITLPTDEQPRKSKKERKAERKAKEAAEKAQAQEYPKEQGQEKNPSNEITSAGDKKSKKNNRNREKKRLAKANGEEGKEPRFIVFIGKHQYCSCSSLNLNFSNLYPRKPPIQRDQRVCGKAFCSSEAQVSTAFDSKRQPLQIKGNCICRVRWL